MANFQYHASQLDGQMVRGTSTADDPHQLATELQAKGLFLVSWNIIAPEEPPSVPIPPQPVETIPVGQRFEDRIDAQTPLTRKQKVFLFSVLIGGILIGFARVYALRHPKITTDLLNEKLSHLHGDMTRGDIESVFDKRHFDAQQADKVRYFVPPDFIVEILYDQTGGIGSPQNHRNQTVPLKISRTSDLRPTS